MENVKIKNHFMVMFEEQIIDLLKKQIHGSNNILKNVEGNLLKYQNLKIKRNKSKRNLKEKVLIKPAKVSTLFQVKV